MKMMDCGWWLTTQLTNDLIITSLLRQNDVHTSFDVIMALFLRHVSVGNECCHLNIIPVLMQVWWMVVNWPNLAGIKSTTKTQISQTFCISTILMNTENDICILAFRGNGENTVPLMFHEKYLFTSRDCLTNTNKGILPYPNSVVDIYMYPNVHRVINTEYHMLIC